MAGYSYAKRSVHPSWLVKITLKEVSALFMAGYNYTKRSVHPSWLVKITLKEESALFMAGYNYTVMKRVNTSFSVTVTSHEESEHFF
jgi:hypothetical protein